MVKYKQWNSMEYGKLLIPVYDHHTRPTEISLSDRKVCCSFLSAKPETNAMVRTTTAVTEFHAGIKVCA